MTTVSPDARTARLVEAYSGLTRENLPALLLLYDQEAAFKDPFNDVRGRTAIQRIFNQMFDELRDPRFVVMRSASQDNDAFLTWELHFLRQNARPMTIRGATHLQYSSADLVVLHRDYWDAAEELYAKLPVIGVLMRALKRRLSTPEPPRNF